MPQHKAATDVTIAKADDRSEFGEWILSNWKLMASLAVLVAIAILTFQYVREQRKEALTTSWNKVWAHVEPGGSMAGFTGDAEALASTFPELEKTQVGPWALYLQAKIHGEKREYQAGVEALRKLQDLYPAHPLTTERYAFGGEGPPLTIAERLLQSLRAQGQWEQGREHLFGNPSPPTDAPRVQLETSEGAIVVQLYPDRAPKHVDNFLKLVRNGFYTGTRFHRVEPGFMIQGGDPTSKEDDRSLWGTGGPGYTVEPEQNELRHFTGYLAAAKPDGASESSGSQIYITVAPAHHLDGKHVVFGKVVEGMKVAHWIEGGQLDSNPMRRGQPIQPVTILSAAVL